MHTHVKENDNGSDSVKVEEHEKIQQNDKERHQRAMMCKRKEITTKEK